MNKTLMLAVIASAMTMAATSASAAQGLTYKVGVGQVTETYDEFDTSGEKFMTEKASNMTELSGQVDLDVNDGVVYRLKGNYAWGKSKYTGAYQGGNYGDLVIDGQDRSRYSVTGLALMKLPDNGTFTARAGVGLGYRYLEDKLSQAGPGGYDRVNQLKLGVATLEADVPVKDGWVVSPAVSVMYLISGKQESKMSDATIVHNQDKGHGYEVSVGISNDFKGNRVELTPYVTKWDIKASDYTVYNGSLTVEPHNKTTEAGVRVSVSF